MEADTWATCTARLEAGELADHTDPRTNTPRHAPLGRASGTRRQAASGHQRSVRHTKRRPGATKRALISSRVLLGGIDPAWSQSTASAGLTSPAATNRDDPLDVARAANDTCAGSLESADR